MNTSNKKNVFTISSQCSHYIPGSSSEHGSIQEWKGTEIGNLRKESKFNHCYVATFLRKHHTIRIMGGFLVMLLSLTILCYYSPRCLIPRELWLTFFAFTCISPWNLSCSPVRVLQKTLTDLRVAVAHAPSSNNLSLNPPPEVLCPSRSALPSTSKVSSPTMHPSALCSPTLSSKIAWDEQQSSSPAGLKQEAGKGDGKKSHCSLPFDPRPQSPLGLRRHRSNAPQSELQYATDRSSFLFYCTRFLYTHFFITKYREFSGGKSLVGFSLSDQGPRPSMVYLLQQRTLFALGQVLLVLVSRH